MKKLFTPLIISLSLMNLYSCENRDINEGESFEPREIHKDIVFNFDKITVDGIEYLILEKDNNNPHEGFGFMAFRANKLMEKQDTIMAYLNTLYEIQIKTYAATTGISIQNAKTEADKILKTNIEGFSELKNLEENKLRGSTFDESK